MKTADSGIHLRNIRLHSPLDCLRHKMRLNLSFLSPKRFINDIGNTSAFDTEFLTALQKFYTKKQRVSLDSIAVEQWGIIWEYIEFERLVISSKLNYFYFGTSKLAELTIK